MPRFGLAQDRWIGGTDAASEGSLVWTRSSSDPWQFTFWNDCTLVNDNTKNCVKVAAQQNSRWEMEDCDAKLERYLCQKGTSTSLFWNEHVNGNNYAYIERHRAKCEDNVWETFKNLCRGLGDGADIADIPHSSHETFISNTFSANAFDSNYFWIGLNDQSSEGTFVWASGSNVPVYRQSGDLSLVQIHPDTVL